MRSRQRAFVALVAGMLIVLVGLVPSGPAAAEPNLQDVRSTVDRLYREAEQAVERHHAARVELEQVRAELESVEADRDRQSAQLDDVRGDVRDSIIRQYQGRVLGGAGELLSLDSESFLQEMSTVSTVNRLQDAVLDRYGTELEALAARTDQVDERRDRLAELEERLADEAAVANAKYQQAEDLLDTLEAEERRAVLSRQAQPAATPSEEPAATPSKEPAATPSKEPAATPSKEPAATPSKEPAPASREAQPAPEEQQAASPDPAPSPPPEPPAPSGDVQAVLDYAMAQVGDRYVWGAEGPDAFDCSGLTMQAWAQAGVSLPHSSAAQFEYGRRVSRSQLQPGDLVFQYSPISHVGIYIGDGLMVHAANPGDGVRIDPISLMPYAGAVRPG